MSKVRLGHPLRVSDVSAWQALSSDVGDVLRPYSSRGNSNRILIQLFAEIVQNAADTRTRDLAINFFRDEYVHRSLTWFSHPRYNHTGAILSSRLPDGVMHRPPCQ